jgi:hypothetical protein
MHTGVFVSNAMATNDGKKKVFPDTQKRNVLSVWDVTILTELHGSGYLGTVRALRCDDLLSKEI